MGRACMKHLKIWSPIAALAVAGLAVTGVRPQAQGQSTPNARNDYPNPYRTVEGWAKLPEGRTWGSTSSVDIDKDGVSVWVGERCGTNSCLTSTLDPVLKFDSTGKLVKSFGSGLVIFPHGISVDRDGNIWIVDGQDNAPRPARGAAPAAGATPAPLPLGPPAGGTKGNQVIKFSPDGKVLLTLGKPGGAASPEYFYQPNDVVTAPNGDIFVSEGHGAGNNRILKFDKTGKFIKEWGKLGTGPGEFDQPHALAFDAQGRLFVGDRNNNRVQVFDQDGKFITEYKQFSRPSGIFIKGDTLYVADSESESVSRNHDGWKRGIRWGSIKDGKIQGFIPDPETKTRAEGFSGTSAAEGVAVDSAGNIYGAE